MKQKLRLFMSSRMKVLIALALAFILTAGSIATVMGLEAFGGSGPVFQEPTGGRVLHMRADGSDANDGSSWADAIQTFHHLSSIVQPGDTVLLSDRDGEFDIRYPSDINHNGGSRYGDRLALTSVGARHNVAQTITIMAYQDERPIIRSKPHTGGSFIHLTDVHNVSFIGLTFLDIGYNRVIQESGNIVFNIHASTNISLINNVVDNQWNTDFGANPVSGAGSAMQIWGGCTFTIRGNYFNGSGNSLVRSARFPNASGGVDMVQIYGAHNVLVEFNYFGNGGHAALIICDRVFLQGDNSAPENLGSGNRQAVNIVVQFNTFANAWGGGFYFGRSFGDVGAHGPQEDRMNPHRSGDRPGDGGFAGHHLIQNNIVYKIGQNVAYQKFGLTPYGNEGSIIRHNIMAHHGGYFGVPNSPLGMTAFGGVYGGAVAPHRHRFFNNVTFRNASPAVILSEGGGSEGGPQGGIIRDVEYKNNIFFEDNHHFNRNTQYTTALPQFPGPNRPQIEVIAHNTRIDPRTRNTPRDGRTLQENFIHYFPSTNRFINNIILAPEGRPVQIQFWSPPALGGGWVRTLDEVQQQFPLRDMAAIGFPGIQGGFHGNMEVDPMFERISAHGAPINLEDMSFRLQAGSPAINAGANLTYTSQTGSNTRQVHVRDALYFTCGLGLIPGDPIIVGDNDIVRVVAVDYRNAILTVNRDISFGLGDAVNLPFNGLRPDIGAFKFTEEPEILVDTVNRNGTDLEILGVITSDAWQNITAFVRNGTGDIVHVARAISTNSGSFQLLIPLPTSNTYEVTITGTDVIAPNVVTVS